MCVSLEKGIKDFQLAHFTFMDVLDGDSYLGEEALRLVDENPDTTLHKWSQIGQSPLWSKLARHIGTDILADVVRVR